MSPIKEMESAVFASTKIYENAEKNGWRLIKETGFEMKNQVGVRILVFEKNAEPKFPDQRPPKVREIAGVIFNRNIGDIREGRGDIVFGPEELLQGLKFLEDE